MQTSLQQFIFEYRLPIFLTSLGLILLAGGLFFSESRQLAEKEYPKESIVSTQQITVDISGAIKNPGVYKLSEGSRIQDAVDRAGGFTEETNKEYIVKTLNMAQKIVDGTKVYIPFENEDSSTLTTSSAVDGVSSTKVNINTASQTELEALSGIGPVTASKIISNRPYQKVEELVSKKAISQALFEKLKNSLVVY